MINIKPMIDKGGVFSALADITAFKNIITTMNGTVAWDIKGSWNPAEVLDIDPIVLYLNG